MVRQVKKTRTGSVERNVESMCWGQMVGTHGGNEKVTLESLKRGDIVRTRNPDTNKVEYATAKTTRPIVTIIRHIVY